MARSQNGFTANDRSVIATQTVPGTTVRLPVRRGPAGDLLIAAAARWHREVEPLVQPGNWGYAERTIRGSATTLSNHASGTAIDLNAPAHPLGTEPARNFTRAQIAAVRRIVADYAPALRWGGDYTGRKDGMHLEIVAAEAVCAAVLARTPGARPAAPVTTSKERDMENTFPVPDYYTENPNDRMWVSEAIAWGTAHAAHARDAARSADARAARIEKVLAAIDARLAKLEGKA